MWLDILLSLSVFHWPSMEKDIINQKSKNQKNQKIKSLIIWLFSQEMELLPCNLPPCHLRQCFIDLFWSRMYGKLLKKSKNQNNQRVWFFWLFDNLPYKIILALSPPLTSTAPPWRSPKPQNKSKNQN